MTRATILLLGLALVPACRSSSPGPSTGRVVSLDRRPVYRVPIRITGCPDQVTSEDGSFDASCAATTYDVALPYDGVIYQGLTRRDPVITIPFTLAYDAMTEVSGTVQGRTDGRTSGVVVTTASYAEPGLAEVSFDGTFRRTTYRLAPDAPTATVRALEWTGTAGVADAYTGYGEATVSLLPEDDHAVSPVLAAVANGSIQVSAYAADRSALRFRLWATWPEGGMSEIGSTDYGTADRALATPALPGVTFTAVAESDGDVLQAAWRAGLAATATPPRIDLPAAPAFTAPAPDATVDGTTAFTFDAVEDAIHVVGFESEIYGGPMLYVVTRATTVRIPDFSWAGMPVPSGMTLVASVGAVGPFASMDEATGGPIAVLPRAQAGWIVDRLPAVDGFAARRTMFVHAR